MNTKNQILIILAIAFLSFTGCKKETSIEFNNEVMITLSKGMGCSTVEGWTYPIYIPYFDISNYSNIKSAVLLVSDIKSNDDNGDVIGEGTWQLYDITNDKIIENSDISSDDIPENTYKSSVNFVDNIPNEKIKLGILVKSGGNYLVECGSITLVLSR